MIVLIIETVLTEICLTYTISIIYRNWYNPIVWYRKPAILITTLFIMFSANSYAKYKVQHEYTLQRSTILFDEFFKYLILIFFLGIILFLLKEFIIGKRSKSIYRWKGDKIKH